jgi:hypothetical protein
MDHASSGGGEDGTHVAQNAFDGSPTDWISPRREVLSPMRLQRLYETVSLTPRQGQRGGPTPHRTAASHLHPNDRTGDKQSADGSSRKCGQATMIPPALKETVRRSAVACELRSRTSSRNCYVAEVEKRQYGSPVSTTVVRSPPPPPSSSARLVRVTTPPPHYDFVEQPPSPNSRQEAIRREAFDTRNLAVSYGNAAMEYSGTVIAASPRPYFDELALKRRHHAAVAAAERSPRSASAQRLMMMGLLDTCRSSNTTVPVAHRWQQVFEEAECYDFEPSVPTSGSPTALGTHARDALALLSK